MFVTFEGLDGCGKSTQARRLADFLSGDGLDVVSTREPAGRRSGRRSRSRPARRPRRAVGGGDAYRARAQHVDQVIRPALPRRDRRLRPLPRHVCRLPGRGRGLGADVILDLNLHAVGGLLPDRTFLVEIDAALARVGDKGDRIERAGAEFWPRVVDAYRELAERFPERYVVIDGSRSVDEIAAEVRERLR